MAWTPNATAQLALLRKSTRKLARGPLALLSDRKLILPSDLNGRAGAMIEAIQLREILWPASQPVGQTVRISGREWAAKSDSRWPLAR